jgi:Fe-S-cluster containining protein
VSTKRNDIFPVTSCDCPDCRAACLNSPGWFMPNQIAPLADHLGLTVPELFNSKLAVGVTRLADGSEVHGLMPHKLRDRKKPGSVWSLVELAEPGRCIFYDRGLCTIYKYRPYECARMMHDRPQESIKLRRRIVPHWTREALREFGELVGRKLMGAKPKGATLNGAKLNGAKPRG